MIDKKTYTKNDLIKSIHQKLDLPKDKIKLIVEIVLESMTDIFMEEKSNIRLEIRNFGVFEIKKTQQKKII